MKINVSDKVLAGNIGEWRDEWAAAKSLAQAICDAYTAEIESEYPESEISVTVTPERASGYHSGVEVWVEDAGDDAFEIMDDLTLRLNEVSQSTWESFCQEYDED